MEAVARKTERALMLRLLGSHQGIRLERLRSELDDRFETLGQRLETLESLDADQTMLVENLMAPIPAESKDLVLIPSDSPSVELDATNRSEGYEWVEHNGSHWYRPEGEKIAWEKYDS